MRTIFLTLFFNFIILIGCSKNCNDSYELNKIEVFNYEMTNPDDIIIKAYKKDSTFAIFKDSFKISKIERIDNPGFDYYCTLNKKLSTNYDYDIYFVKDNRHCKITSIKVKGEKCYDGIFHDDYSYSFDGYYVNDMLFMCGIIKAHP